MMSSLLEVYCQLNLFSLLSSGNRISLLTHLLDLKKSSMFILYIFGCDNGDVLNILHVHLIYWC